MRCLAILFAIAVCSACAGSPSPEDQMLPPLAGTSWTLATLRGEPALRSPEATLTFESDRIVGTGSVNRFFGNWSADDGALSLSGIGSTRMLGPPEAQRQEDLYFAALREIDGARIVDDDLALTAGGVVALTFTPR